MQSQMSQLSSDKSGGCNHQPSLWSSASQQQLCQYQLSSFRQHAHTLLTFYFFFLFLTLSRLQLIANVTGVDQKVNFWMQHNSLRLPSPVKDLPALRKQRFQAALYSAAPPDEAVCWCDVRCAPGAKVRHSALCAGMVELKRCDVSLNMQCHRPILSCYFTSHVRSSNSSKHSWLCMVRNTHIQAAYTAIKAASRRYIFFWSCMSLVQNRCRCLSSVGVRQYTGSVM